MGEVVLFLTVYTHKERGSELVAIYEHNLKVTYLLDNNILDSSILCTGITSTGDFLD
jgi:hypothetical protein